ncbi:hypothetical protein PCE1_002119 [Barthelona sp. PCE]
MNASVSSVDDLESEMPLMFSASDYKTDTTQIQQSDEESESENEKMGRRPPIVPSLSSKLKLLGQTQITNQTFSLHFDVPFKTTERVLSMIPQYPSDRFSAGDLWADSDRTQINLEKLQNGLELEYRLHPEDCLRIIELAMEKFKKEPNVLTAKGNAVVIGSLYSQFYDFVQILRNGKHPATTQFIVLGNIVGGNGYFGTELLLMLLALKVMHPKTTILLRGKAESRMQTSFQHFKKECLVKYNIAVYDAFCDVFDYFPLACVLDRRFFCVSSGISPKVENVKELLAIDRVEEPRTLEENILLDIIRAEPSQASTGFEKQDVCESYFYGVDAVSQFLENNSLLCVMRSGMNDDGFVFGEPHVFTRFPMLISVHSCCDHPFTDPTGQTFDVNVAGYIDYSNETITLNKFTMEPAARPFWLPGFGNLFDLANNFVFQEMVSILASLANAALLAPITAGRNSQRSSLRSNRDRERLRQKVLAMGRMAAAFKQDQEMHFGFVGQLPNVLKQRNDFTEIVDLVTSNDRSKMLLMQFVNSNSDKLKDPNLLSILQNPDDHVNVGPVNAMKILKKMQK